MFHKIGFFLIAVFSLPVAALAQPESSVYKGFRISLFDVSIKKRKDDQISLKLSVANTGRLPVSLGKKNEPAPENLVIELDTVNLPLVLQGREILLSEAMRKEKFSLQPGEILRDFSLEIDWEMPDTPIVSSPSGQVCPDLTLDTVYVAEFSEKTMLLRFMVRNAGNAAANLLGESDKAEDNLALNVYFNSGTKLTRGAILAGGIFIQKGRETLDGLLLPGQVLAGEMEISLANRTRFTSSLVFELDPFQTVNDCNRANNTKGITPGF